MTAPPVLPLDPNWDRPLQMQYGFLTDVLEADAVVEQRRAIRSIPTIRQVFTLLARDAVESAAQDALLRTGLATTWLVPIWAHETRLAAPLAAASVAVPVVTTPRMYSAPGFALLWRAWNDWEILTVTTLSGTELTVDPVVDDWPATTALVPLVLGQLISAINVDRPDINKTVTELTLDLLNVTTYGITEPEEE